VLEIGKGNYRKATRADRKAKKTGLTLVGPTLTLIALYAPIEALWDLLIG
jgi:hypothetical protein